MVSAEALNTQTMSSRVFNLTSAITECCPMDRYDKPSIPSSEGGPTQSQNTFGSTASESHPRVRQPRTDNAHAPPHSRPPVSHDATIALAIAKHVQQAEQFVTARLSTFGTISARCRLQGSFDECTAIAPHGHFCHAPSKPQC